MLRHPVRFELADSVGALALLLDFAHNLLVALVLIFWARCALEAGHAGGWALDLQGCGGCGDARCNEESTEHLG